MKPLFAAAAALLAGVPVAHAEPADYAIDPAHSFVTFEVRHFGTSTVRGRFAVRPGRVVLDRAARSGMADITIPTASVDSGIAAFDEHLRHPDFFDAAAHPDLRFVSERFVFEGDKLASVPGQLTLLGKTLPVTLTATNYNCYDNPRSKREVCGGDFETTIQRSRWGMNFGLPGIPDHVRLVIQIEAARQ